MEQVYTGVLKEPFPWRCRYKSQHVGRFGVFVQYQTDVDDNVTIFVPCPYGGPGDRLWVRETWLELDTDHQPLRYSYRVDITDPEQEEIRKAYGYKWRPSIHMPRWASRITLEVVDVRAERVQKITDVDVQAEGIYGVMQQKTIWYAGLGQGFPTPTAAFCGLWDSIYAKKGFGWETNPWVFVTEFKRIC